MAGWSGDSTSGGAAAIKKVTYPGTGNNSQFSYDCYGSNVQILEYSGGTLQSTKEFVCMGNSRCEARNASGTIVAQFFGLGETISGTTYVYTKDHLGSIREMTNSSGAVQSQYSYDAYGQVLRLQGSLAADLQYGGLYEHASSGLNLTRARAYNPAIGRFINRDPYGLRGGLNLYRYAWNEPVRYSDPLGLDPLEPLCAGIPAATLLGLAKAAGSFSTNGISEYSMVLTKNGVQFMAPNITTGQDSSGNYTAVNGAQAQYAMAVLSSLGLGFGAMGPIAVAVHTHQTDVPGTDPYSFSQPDINNGNGLSNPIIVVTADGLIGYKGISSDPKDPNPDGWFDKNCCFHKSFKTRWGYRGCELKCSDPPP